MLVYVCMLVYVYVCRYTCVRARKQEPDIKLKFKSLKKFAIKFL